MAPDSTGHFTQLVYLPAAGGVLSVLFLQAAGGQEAERASASRPFGESCGDMALGARRCRATWQNGAAGGRPCGRGGGPWPQSMGQLAPALPGADR